MYKVLFETVSSIMEMTEYDKTLCFEYFEPVKFPKNTIVEDANKIPQYQYFVVSGIMRNYFYNASGEAVTTDLNYSPRFFTSYNNFVKRCISDEIIECVTDCELLRVKRDDVDILYSESLILKDFTIRYLEKVFEEERTRIIELTTLTARQRYINLLNKAPIIILGVPLQHIASYLGIKPETLSRIRRKTIS
jgi:CRP-like cAMP-binding protein